MASKTVVARFQRLQDMGCYCCAKLGWYSDCDIHHIVKGNRRLGHNFTLNLCPYHHRGNLLDGWTRYDMVKKFGPSLAQGTKPFEAYWGTQLQILEEINARITGIPTSDDKTIAAAVEQTA